MISVIKAEFRKYVRRPAIRAVVALVALLVALNYGISLAGLIDPSFAPGTGIDVKALYPDQFVNEATGAVGIAAAMAMISGALMAGSDYTLGTLKTALTQRVGRLTTVAGRVTTYLLFTAFLTLVILGMSVAGSLIVASYEHHGVAWPVAVDVAKGFGAIWLALSTSGALGLFLGTLFRQPAVALGVGLVYGLALQVLVVQFVASINNGAYKWLADLFEGRNTNALMQSFGGVAHTDISATRAVTVLFVYIVLYVIATAALVRQRDVA